MSVRVKYSDSLKHYGKKGMHWGERKYQNEDGSYTALGRIHYGIGQGRKAIGNAATSVVNRARSAAPGIKKAASNAGKTAVKIGAAAALAKGITSGASDKDIIDRTNRNNLLTNYKRSRVSNKLVDKLGKAESYRAKKAKKRAKMEYKQAKWQYQRAKSERGIAGAVKKVGGFVIGTAATAAGSALMNRIISGTTKDAFEQTKREISMKDYYEKGKLTPKQKKAYERELKRQGYSNDELNNMWNSKDAKGGDTAKSSVAGSGNTSKFKIQLSELATETAYGKLVQDALNTSAGTTYTPSDDSLGARAGAAVWENMSGGMQQTSFDYGDYGNLGTVGSYTERKN